MNLRSLNTELETNNSNLEFAKRTIGILQKGNPVNQKLLNEAVGLKRQIELKISELVREIAKAEKNAKKNR